MIKKIISVLLVLSVIFTLSACAGKAEEQETAPQIVNPWSDYSTMEEMNLATGIDAVCPVIQGCTASFRGMNGLSEAVYAGETDKITFRAGTDYDVSGDYNEYNEQELKFLSDCEITEKGDEGKVSLIIWHGIERNFSLSFDPALPKADAENIAEVFIDANRDESMVPIETPDENAPSVFDVITKYNSLEEAEEAATFKISSPSQIEDFNISGYSASSGMILQNEYNDENGLLWVRKGVDNVSVSGSIGVGETDYIATVNGFECSFKTNGETVDCISWVGEEGNAFAMIFSPAIAKDRAESIALNYITEIR